MTRNDRRDAIAATIRIDGPPPLEPPIAMMVIHAEREWIDRLRSGSPQ